MKIIFEDSHYRAVEKAGNEGQPYVITFSSWSRLYQPHIGKDFARTFGLDAISRTGLNCISLVTNKNDWYQGQSALKAIEAIKLRIPQQSVIVTYGSSMGGFAAINFAEALGADQFVSISPQVSLSKPYMESIRDNRFRKEMLTVRKNNEFILAGRNAEKTGYIFFDDKYPLDAAHALECAARTKAVLVPISYSGHHAAKALNSCYGLKKVVEEVARNSFNNDSISRIIRHNADHSLNALAANIDRIEDFCSRYLENPDGVTPDTIELLVDTIVSSGQKPRMTTLAIALNLLLLRAGRMKKNNPGRYNRLHEKLAGFMRLHHLGNLP